MDIRIIHFYPDLMSLYGSYANIAVLKRYFERLGDEVAVESLRPGDSADISGADFLYMGAGTERAARAAMEDFARFGDAVKAAAEDGAAMLFAGTAMDLLGTTVAEADGSVWQGIGLAEFSTRRGSIRNVGDVYARTDLFPEAVVGFMNKCSSTSGVKEPLLTEVLVGFGNEEACGPEGLHWKNVFASQLTGPILVKNPKLLEAAASAVYARRGAQLPEKRPVDPWAEKSYTVTEEQLRRRFLE